MSDWQRCIISFIDLIGTKSNAHTGEASTTMRKVHGVAHGVASHMLEMHAHTYIWNDSVLMLAYIEDEARETRGIMQEVSLMKEKIDAVARSYAISVKGKTFPYESVTNCPVFSGKIADQPKALIIKASSYAMGNCYLIEHALGRKHKKDWYIDSRIARQAMIAKEPVIDAVQLLPSMEQREIFMYSGSLFDVDVGETY